MKIPGVKYQIHWATKHKQLVSVNQVLIKGTDFDECLKIILYDKDLIKEVLNKIDKHNPSHIEFKFVDLHGPPIVFESNEFQNLIQQWMDAMISEEEYEIAAYIRDFKI